MGAQIDANAPDTLVTRATVSGGGSAEAASAEDEITLLPAIPFGVKAFDVKVENDEGGDYTQAGGHPYAAGSTFEFNEHVRAEKSAEAGLRASTGLIKHINIETPRGFVGNAQALIAKCPSIEDLTESTCPAESAVGGITLETGLGTFADVPIYSIAQEYGVPAEFAFAIPVVHLVYTFKPELRADDGYAISLIAAPVNKLPELFGVDATLCSFGVKIKSTHFERCKAAADLDANPVPLITTPTRCAGPPPRTVLAVDSWEEPGKFVRKSTSSPPLSGCEDVEFEPQIELKPISHQADSPTGLDVGLTMPTEGLESPEGISQANLKRAKITFPEGMAINATAGKGLGACSAGQVKLKTNDPISCPDSSKIGSAEVDTPLIEETLRGAIYVAKQGNVGGAPIGFYLVLESKKDGILIKVPGRVDPNPKTGQLVVTFDESPEAPFSAVRIHFAQGPRSPLLSPPRCGNYRIKAELSPWTAVDPDNPTQAETVTQSSTFLVNRGPGGGPCPKGALEPKLEAGATEPIAGDASPFVVRLHREDGTQRFSSLNMNLPKGLTAYLRGIPYCPDSDIESISTALEAGQGEIDHPSCPQASQVGTASAGAGAGQDPFYVNTGRVYLAGPYKGAPASIVVVAPAVAGPLDLGNVVVRNAVYVDPETAQVSVVSDPIPTILHGILPDIRDIRVVIDRPSFTLNPTSCEEKSIDVAVKGETGGSASVSNHYQVGGCENLAFKPKATTTLTGPTGRGGHPALKGVLTPRPGDANLKSTVVTIPHSEFLDQAHIRTICTRVQFAANSCPQGSIYGHATATTPLLDYPLSGPVYLRSSSHKLPDLVVAVKGPDYQPIQAVAVARIDSIKGQIRASFEAVPDVPLSKVVIEMQGGKKGLLVNSRDICASPYKADLLLGAHNGRESEVRPVLRNGKCGAGRKGKGRTGKGSHRK